MKMLIIIHIMKMMQRLNIWGLMMAIQNAFLSYQTGVM